MCIFIQKKGENPLKNNVPVLEKLQLSQEIKSYNIKPDSQIQRCEDPSQSTQLSCLTAAFFR